MLDLAVRGRDGHQQEILTSNSASSHSADKEDFSNSEVALTDLLNTLKGVISNIQKEMTMKYAFLQKKIDIRSVKTFETTFTAVTNLVVYRLCHTGIGGADLVVPPIFER